MPERVLSERQRLSLAVKAVFVRLALSHPAGATAEQRLSAIWDAARRVPDEKWNDFLAACLEVCGPLIQTSNPSVHILPDGILCDWCFEACIEARRTPGCPFCLPARRAFEASRQTADEASHEDIPR